MLAIHPVIVYTTGVLSVIICGSWSVVGYSRDSDRLQDDRKGMLQGKARVDSKTQSALSDSPRNRDRKRQDSKSESSQKSNKDKNEVSQFKKKT